MKKHSLLTFFLLVLIVSTSSVYATHQLPTLYLDTPDGTGITSTDEWQQHIRLRIVMPDGNTNYQSDSNSAKIRGHSTATKAKKPYALRLEKRASLLGMNAHKRWVLLANVMDHSHVRNALALSAARQTALKWTPDFRWVDVVLNGQPQGCYLLCEQIRVDRHRVDVDEDEGWLLEVDAYFDEPYRFRTAHRNLPVNIKAPDKPTATQMDYIKHYLDSIESRLYDVRQDAGLLPLYRDYIDAKSFADWWIIHEVTQNAEPNGPRSCYLYKDKGGKLYAGPVWDFDLAFIDVDLDAGGDLRPTRLNRPDVTRLTGDSLYNRRALWYDRLLQDKTFRRLVQRRWQELSPRFRALAQDIDRWHDLLRPSAEDDERLWPAADPARFDPYPTFEASLQHVKRAWLYRIDRLDEMLAP